MKKKKRKISVQEYKQVWFIKKKWSRMPNATAGDWTSSNDFGTKIPWLQESQDEKHPTMVVWEKERKWNVQSLHRQFQAFHKIGIKNDVSELMDSREVLFFFRWDT